MILVFIVCLGSCFCSCRWYKIWLEKLACQSAKLAKKRNRNIQPTIGLKSYDFSNAPSSGPDWSSEVQTISA